ncbi:MAG: enhanced intracellular survival protein Eis [Promethearchaeota archaeon]
MVEIRRITKQERRAVSDLRKYAFSSWSDEKAKDEELTTIMPEETLGLFDDGKLVSTIELLSLQQSIRGIVKNMGGIANVATYPEARRKGYVDELMRAVFSKMKKQDIPVSMLAPFKESFYRRFGYIKANTHMNVKAPLTALRTSLNDEISGEWKVERVRAVEAKEPFLEFIMDFAPSRIHGIVFDPKISDEVWKRRNKDAVIIFVKNKDTIEAMARYRTKNYIWGAEPSHLVVHEMYWRTLAARNILFTFLAKHTDQFEHIIMQLPFGINFQHWFTDSMNKFEISMYLPWMVRVIDVKNAIMDIPSSGTAEISIQVSDPYCKWNNDLFTIQSKDGRLKVHKGSGNPDAKMTIEGISALVYGTLSVEELEFKGWLELSDTKTGIKLQQWFPVIPIHNAFHY